MHPSISKDAGVSLVVFADKQKTSCHVQQLGPHQTFAV